MYIHLSQWLHVSHIFCFCCEGVPDIHRGIDMFYINMNGVFYIITYSPFPPPTFFNRF